MHELSRQASGAGRRFSRAGLAVRAGGWLDRLRRADRRRRACAAHSGAGLQRREPRPLGASRRPRFWPPRPSAPARGDRDHHGQSHLAADRLWRSARAFPRWPADSLGSARRTGRSDARPAWRDGRARDRSGRVLRSGRRGDQGRFDRHPLPRHERPQWVDSPRRAVHVWRVRRFSGGTARRRRGAAADADERVHGVGRSRAGDGRFRRAARIQSSLWRHARSGHPPRAGVRPSAGRRSAATGPRSAAARLDPGAAPLASVAVAGSPRPRESPECSAPQDHSARRRRIGARRGRHPRVLGRRAGSSVRDAPASLARRRAPRSRRAAAAATRRV